MTSILPTTTAATSGSSTADHAQQSLAGNFNTFLKLLTTQLQHQDPLSPMDSNQFTQQLVEFANVEQQINSNKNLEKLVSLTVGSSTSSAAAYIGRQVTAGGKDAKLANGQANWAYSLGSDANATNITIKDASGSVVYASKGDTSAGPHTFSWDGRTNDGGTAPDGTYSITVSATDASKNPIATSTTIQGTVSTVDIVGSQPMIKVNGIDLDPSQILSIGPAPTSGTTSSTTSSTNTQGTGA
jgi:flagellar basal-body rod modification protein FlgD